MMVDNELPLTDETEFNRIVQTHYGVLLSTALQITKHRQSAEDIVQEAFLRLWKNRIRIIPYNIGGWLHRVTIHLAYKHVQRETRRNSIYAKLNKARPGWHTDVEEHLLKKENQNTYDAAYLRLPERQQAVYRLSREQGLSRDEIACQLSISPNTVKNHLLKALQFMKDHIQTGALLIALFVFNNFFFVPTSTISPLKDLYKREQKVNSKPILLQHGFYFKNSTSLSPVLQRLGNTGY